MEMLFNVKLRLGYRLSAVIFLLLTTAYRLLFKNIYCNAVLGDSSPQIAVWFWLNSENFFTFCLLGDSADHFCTRLILELLEIVRAANQCLTVKEFFSETWFLYFAIKN